MRAIRRVRGLVLNSLLTAPLPLRHKQKVMALADAEAECALKHGHSQKFFDPLSVINDYRGQTVMVKKKKDPSVTAN